MTDQFTCYQFGKNYTWLRIYWFDPKTRYCGMIVTCTPFKGATRRKRFEVMCNHLTRANIPHPTYKPTKKEPAQ